MRYITLSELLVLYAMVIRWTGGVTGIRDQAALESGVAQPMTACGGRELYSSIEEKATALCFSLVTDRPFVDGNKRIGHAALEVFLVLNSLELVAEVDDSEATILALACGELSREELLAWVKRNRKPLDAIQ